MPPLHLGTLFVGVGVGVKTSLSIVAAVCAFGCILWADFIRYIPRAELSYEILRRALYEPSVALIHIRICVANP